MALQFYKGLLEILETKFLLSRLQRPYPDPQAPTPSTPPSTLTD